MVKSSFPFFYLALHIIIQVCRTEHVKGRVRGLVAKNQGKKGGPKKGVPKKGKCPCLEESEEFHQKWYDAVNEGGPFDFFLNDETDYRIQIDVQNGENELICGTIPTMVFVRGACNFQEPVRYESYTCSDEGWSGSSIWNGDGPELSFDTLSLKKFAVCKEEIKNIWGVVGT